MQDNTANLTGPQQTEPNKDTYMIMAAVLLDIIFELDPKTFKDIQRELIHSAAGIAIEHYDDIQAAFAREGLRSPPVLGAFIRNIRNRAQA